jgi:hypothetical protein
MLERIEKKLSIRFRRIDVTPPEESVTGEMMSDGGLSGY